MALDDVQEEACELASPCIAVHRGAAASAWLGWTSFLLAVAPLAFMMIAGGLLGVDKPAWWGDTVLGSVWGTAAAAAVVSLVLRKKTSAGTIAVEGDVLRIRQGGITHRFASNEVLNATLVPGRALLFELVDGRRITAELTDTQRAERLLSRLAVGADRRRFHSRLAASKLRPVAAAGAFVALFALAVVAKENLPRFAGGAVFAVGALMALAGLLVGMRPPRIEVGADGVRISHRFRSQVVRFGDLVGVVADDDALVLTRASGDPVRVPIPMGNATQLDALRHRIELGMAASAALPDASERLALFARRGREIADWRRELGGLVGQDVGYRRLPLSRDDLEAILAAPTTSLEQRIGAALALHEVLGDEAAPKIRIAADRCVQESARVALERAAEGELELEMLDAALAEERGRKRW